MKEYMNEFLEKYDLSNMTGADIIFIWQMFVIGKAIGTIIDE